MEHEYELETVQPRPVMAVQQQSKAVQEVQAAFVIAKKFPRDSTAVYTRILESCRRLGLADKAMYKYPRGGQVVTGPSIRLAEVLAQNWGNLDFGVREIERRTLDNGETVSVAESYCIDLETNTRQTKTFEVPHKMALKGGKEKKLTDPRDIYELVANNGARRMRACILGIIPIDMVEAAVDECRKTVAKGNGEPISDRIRRMVLAFKDLGVDQEMIEKKLGHSMEITTGEEIADLTAIYASLKDKQAKRSDFFDFGSEETGGKASDLSEALKEKKNG